ncbi:MAG: InlB B-repeat-containing protein, partial [Dehalococcoidia bacterium]
MKKIVLLISVTLILLISIGLPSNVLASLDNWKINMGITTDPNIGSVITGNLAFGAKDGASNAFSSSEGDALGAVNPAEGINAYFSYPENSPSTTRKLAKSIVAPATTITWNLVALTVGGENALMTMTWDASGIPSKYTSLELQDTSGTVLRNMRTTNSYQFNVTPDQTYNFKIVATATQYTLTTHVDPASTGEVTLNPPGGTYDAGTPVELTANATNGYIFSHWSGALTGNTNPATITMDGNKDVTANFAPHLLINEFYSYDSSGDWVELYNPTSQAVSLIGWTLGESDTGYPGALSGEIPAGSYLQIGMSNRLNRDGDTITLKKGTSEIDKVVYGNALNAPASTITGKSTGRCPNGADTNVDNVDFKVLDIPTPGAANICVAHTVTFNLGAHGTQTGGGALVQTVAHGGAATAPEVQANEGWTFTGWDKAFTNVTSDLTVTAQYTQITHTVTFDLGTHGIRTGGGALVQTVAHGGAAIAPEVQANEGWTFTGWDKAFTNVTSDLTVTAQYTQITHTVTFNLGAHGTRTGGGALVQTVAHGSAATAPEVQANEGWTFTGWDKAFTNVTSDLTVAAQYTQITYTVTFNLGTHGIRTGGGALVQTMAHGSAATAPEVQANEGWTFTGWDKAFTNATSDLTVTAQYTQVTYTVNASVTGGHGSVAPTTQTVNHGASATITINPEAGYHIAGITDNQNPAAIANPYVISNVVANHTVVVTFAINTYTVNASVTGGHGTVDPTTQTVNHGSSATITINPDAGYHIAGIIDNG